MQRHYFDHNATTPVAPAVLGAMTACLAEVYGNASSIHHFGQRAKQALETARRQIALRIGASPREIVFVSGGTEADNLAIFGTVQTGHAVTTAIEHPAVLHAFEELERRGVAVTYVRVGADGAVDPDDIRRALRPDTALLSVMHANNETGVLQPVAAIAALAREAGVPFHSDGVQAAPRLPVNVPALGVDFYSLSGHKMYAPKGIGALYVREGRALRAIAFGGHHERERRPGTENVAGAVAMGEAAARAFDDTGSLRDRLEAGILAAVPGARVNCAAGPRLPNTTNIRFDGIAGEPLVIALDLRGFAVSTGAACSSGAVEPSHVLTAIGLTPAEARSSVRFSLGASNSEADVDALIDAVRDAVEHLRRIAPRESRSLAHA